MSYIRLLSCGVLLAGIVAVQAVPERPALTELGRAILRGDRPAVRTLLRQGADANQPLTGPPPLPALAAAVWLDRDLAHTILSEASHLDPRQTYLGYSAFDLAVHLYGESDALTRRLAGENQAVGRSRRVKDRNRLVWVANGLAALARDNDPGTTLGLCVITAACNPAGGKAPDREVVLTSARIVRDEVRRQAEASSGPLGPLQVAQVPLSAVKKGLDADLARQIAAEVLAEMLGSLERPGREELLERLYTLGAADGQDAGWLIEQLAGSLFQAVPGEPAATILQRRPDRFRPSAVTLLEGPDKVSRDQLLQAWDRTCSDLVGPEGEGPRSAEQLAACEGSLYLLSGLAEEESPRLARSLKTIGSASLQLAAALTGQQGRKAVTTATGLALTAGSSVTVIGGVATAAMLLSSLSRDADLSEAAIQRQLARLSGQVEQVRREMQQRLDRVDRQLDQLCRQLQTALSSLSRDLAQTREEIRSTALRLALLESQLAALEPGLRTAVEIGTDRSLWREVDRCLSAEGESAVMPSDLARCLDLLRLAGTREARDALSRGPAPEEADLVDEARLAQLVLAEPSEKLGRLALFQAVSRRFGHTGFFSQRTLVNPFRWSHFSGAYVRLASRHGDLWGRHLPATSLDSLLEAGEEWREAVVGLGNDPALPRRLAVHHRGRFDALKHLLRQRTERYQAEHLDGFDVWQPSRKLHFELKEIAPAESLDFQRTGLGTWKGARSLPAPPCLADVRSAQQVFDANLLVAQQLGLGRLELRWSAPGWDEVLPRSLRRDEEQWTGKVSVTVLARFVLANGQVLPLFERRVSAAQETPLAAPGACRKTIWTWTMKPIWPHKPEEEKCSSLWQEELLRQWPEMATRVLLAPTNDQVGPSDRAQRLALVRQRVEEYLGHHRDQLERELRSDPMILEALDQVTAAKRLLRAFLSLGWSRSLTENKELLQLLDGPDGLPDGPALLAQDSLDRVVLEGGTEKTLARMDRLLQALPASKEPLPLVETTMQRLQMLQQWQKLSAPERPLPDVVQTLKETVQHLAR
jgi:hypothetical protein